jgi:hypothetical protein
MSDNFETISVFGRNDGELGIGGNGETRVDNFAVHFTCQGCFGKACAN